MVREYTVEFLAGLQPDTTNIIAENLFFAVGFRRKSICDIKEICDHRKMEDNTKGRPITTSMNGNMFKKTTTKDGTLLGRNGKMEVQVDCIEDQRSNPVELTVCNHRINYRRTSVQVVGPQM
jgi:hypothetical protein